MNKVSISEIANFINGYAFKPSDWNGKGKRIIRIQNLTDKNKPYNFTDIEVPSKYIVEEDDLLVSWSATLDCFIWKGEDALLNQHIFKVEEDETKVKRKYLYYALKNTIETLKNLTHGSTMKHIVKDDFESTQIPLPSLTKQEKIVQLLDNAHSIRQKRRETLRLADEFLRSTFLEMFGDPVVNIHKWPKDQIKVGLNDDVKNENQLDVKKEYEYIDISSIDKSLKIIKNTSKINSMNAPSRAKQLVKKDDLLVSTVRPNLNAVALVKSESRNLIASTGFCVLRSDKKILNPIYLLEITKTSYFVNNMTKIAKGANYPAVTDRDIKEFEIPFPPMDLQIRYAEIVEKTEQLKRKYKQSLQESENLFNSLMQRAFRGEL